MLGSQENNNLPAGQAKLFGLQMEQKTINTIAHVSVGINVLLATNWFLGKYFDIHIFDMFGGKDDKETEV